MKGTAMQVGPDIEAVALAWAKRNRVHRIAAPDGPRGGDREALGRLDPTRGATRYHRHDRMPDWARHRLPVALIGEYLFYVV